MTITDCPGDFVAQAKWLAHQLEERDWPDDIDVSGSYPHVLAQVRHEATNFDELMQELNRHCIQCVRMRGAPCPLRPDNLLEVIDEGQATLTSEANQFAHYLLYPDWRNEHMNRD